MYSVAAIRETQVRETLQGKRCKTLSTHLLHIRVTVTMVCALLAAG